MTPPESRPSNNKLPVFEIWTTDDCKEYAVKISCRKDYTLRTNKDAKYTMIIYAAPYTMTNIEQFADIVAKLLTTKKISERDHESC